MWLTFELGGDVVIVAVEGSTLLFTDSTSNFQRYAPIEGLKLSKAGILKEFPELKELPDSELRTKAIEKFKEKLKAMNSEIEVVNYIIYEFTKMGYTLKLKRRKGFRPERV